MNRIWAALAFALLAAPAQAETSPPGANCTGQPGVAWEHQIKACTAIIDAKETTQANRAVAYRNRGIAHLELIYGKNLDESGDNGKRARTKARNSHLLILDPAREPDATG